MTEMRSAIRQLGCWLAGMAGAVLLAWSTVPAAQAGPMLHYHNQKYGFALQVPADVFVEGVSRNPEVGNIWISRNRQARLMAVAGPNEAGATLEDYRRFVMEKTYAGARFSYTPVRSDWFVLSGVKGNQVFYERITFVCEGRYIYGWQLIYPVRQKRLYDGIVEQIHRNYRVGNGVNGSCG